MFRSIFIRIVCLLSIFAGSGVLAQTSAAIEIDIPAQPVGDALNQFAEQSGLQVVLYADDAEGVETTAVAGKFDDSELVLDALLASTGLDYFFINDRTVSVSSLDDEPGGDSDSKNSSSAPILMAQNATQTQTTVSSRSDDDVAEAREDESPIPLEEIVVTGTNIRGQNNNSAPLITFDRDAIGQSGFTTVQELLSNLPQNFSGGQSEDLQGGVNTQVSVGNVARGSDVNLRGLGGGTTLVLINGRRVAPANFGDFVDVSSIPLSAIERVEILTDGASAIYGSDAIGGVVNFILRDDYDGAETRLRYGESTDGGLEEFRASQTIGKKWSSGNAFVSYEYYERGNLGAEQRDFASAASIPRDLFGNVERHSVLLTGRQDVAENTSLLLDARYSTRDTDSVSSEAFVPIATSDINSEQLDISVGLNTDLGGDWRGEVFGSYSKNEARDETTATIDFFGNVFVNEFLQDLSSDLWSVDAKADGTLFEIPGGPIRLAVGGGYRNESFEAINQNGLVFDGERDLFAGFAEVLIPIFSDANARHGLERLELTVAGRIEDYSDFGTTTNPKIGLSWAPHSSLNVRGTFGTSFRAPLFQDLSESNRQVLYINASDPTALDGTTYTLIELGGNPELQPEEATTWTAGFDFTPESLSGLSINLTYFNIEYDERIANATTSNLTPLLQEDVLAPLIDRSPTLADAQALFVDPEFDNRTSRTGFGPFSDDPNDVGAIVDLRRQNIALTETSGLDVSASYAFDTEAGDFLVSTNVSKLFEIEQAVISTLPSVDIVDTIFNPASLRARSSVGWSNNGLSIVAAVNHTCGYDNNTVDPVVGVESWTTADFQISYRTSDGSQDSLLSNVKLSLNILNAFNEDPPFVQSPLLDARLASVGYDAANADPRGRFVSFEISKEF